jgi:signal transduction histidine kinase
MQWPQFLLPGTARRTARDWAVDVALLAVAVAVSMFVMDDTWEQHSRLGERVDLLLGVFALVALWWRRRRPVGLGAAVLAASALSSGAAGPSLVMLFNAAVRAPLRALAWLTALALAATGTFTAIYPGKSGSWLGEVALGALIVGVAVGWGLFVRARRELVRSLRERAERLEAEQRLRVEQARDAERRRIAGEMHDVLAHRVSLLAVHAGALEFRPGAPPDEIAQAAGVIRRSAQAALQELRDVIGVLRADGDASQPPQPTLDSIPALIEESRAAGMRVRSRIEVAGGEATVGRTAYRVVQEGLTNVRKHAQAASARLLLHFGEDCVRLEVRDDGRGLPDTPRPETGAASAPASGQGFGLLGLQERAARLGGRLDVAPAPGGGTALVVEVPA